MGSDPVRANAVERISARGMRDKASNLDSIARKALGEHCRNGFSRLSPHPHGYLTLRWLQPSIFPSLAGARQSVPWRKLRCVDLSRAAAFKGHEGARALWPSR